MKRREFLRVGLSGAVLANLPLAVKALASAGRARIPIGFVGVTYSHGPDKVRLAMASPDWEFVGVCDDSEAGRQTCERLEARRISREELFAKAVVVAVESEVRDHARHALMALQEGKHVHLEKPPAIRRTDMQELVQLARNKNLLVQTGFMWRYNPGFKTIFQAVREGWLGEVFLVRGFISNNVPRNRRPNWAEFNGGAMFELGSHLIDASVRLLGRPAKITSVLRRHGNFDDSLKDNNVVVLEYDRASVVLVNTALQAGTTPRRSFEVLGTNGTATLRPIEPPTLSVELAKAAGPYESGVHQLSMPAYQRYVGDFAELAAAVRGQQSLTASLDEELLVAEVVLEASEMI